MSVNASEAQRAPTPSRQEIARKLSTTGPPSTGTPQPAQPAAEQASSTDTASQRKHSTGSAVSSSEEEWQTSPLRPPVPLYAISEASDAASGTDSETSSIAAGVVAERREEEERQHGGAVSKALDKLKLSREPTLGMSDNVPIKAGYLRKKGERRKAWKKRWFVLRRGQLALYKNEKEYLLLRLIPLSDIHTCAPIEVKKHSHTFGIVTPKRTYYVEARSDQEVQEWCTAVERAKEDLRSTTSLTTVDSASASGDVTPRGMPSPPPTTSSNMPASSNLSTAPVAIPIPSSSLQQQQQAAHGGEPSSMTTASPSPPPSSMTNSSFLSSSLTSASSVPTLNTTTRVPPNSYAQGPAVGFNNNNAIPPSSLELQTVDAGLERIAEQRQHEASTSLDSTMGMSQAGYFGQRVRSPHGGATPGSPGLVSSSEEDDDDEDEQQQQQQPLQQRSTMLSGGQPVHFAPAPQSPRVDGPASLRRDSAAAPSEDKTIMSGYLMKQGKRKTWRKRWFILTSSRLMYSRSHMDTKIHRQIPLSLILDAIEYEPVKAKGNGLPSTPGGAAASTSPQSGSGALESHAKLNNAFKIITPKRTYLVCAPSEEDEIRWLAALQCLVARKGTAPSTSAPPPASSSAAPRSNSTGASTSQSPQHAAFVNHGRTRSGTLAAKQAIRDAEQRFAVRSS